MSRIEEIKDRLSKATEGDWYIDEDGEVICGRKSDLERIEEGLLPQLIETAFIESNDAKFIAHSKSDIEFLFQEIEKRDKAIELLKTQRNDFNSRLNEVDKEYNYNYLWALDKAIEDVLE